MGGGAWYFLKTLLNAWIVILGVIFLAVYLDNIVLSLFAIYIIASRQNILGLLIHEQAHFLGPKGKIGDIIANLFAGWPLLVLSMENYAKVHLAHHGHYFTEQDPDFMRKNGKDWTFPLSTRHLIWIGLSDFFGINIVKMIKGKNKDVGIIKRPNVMPTWVRIMYLLFFAGLFTYFHIWTIFRIYWILPMLTVLQLIVRLGAICEHKYNVLGGIVAESTPIITLSWWEKLLLPNLNFSYHIYHHYFPGISYRLLPKVHEIFIRDGMVNEKNIFHGYFSFLRYLQTMESR